jgi:cytochrome c biogenesis protein
MQKTNTNNKKQASPPPFGQRLWRFFSSVRLALWLIFIITALSLIGALVIQVPSEASADPSGYSSWLQEIARPKLGPWANILSFLRLLDVFHSPWFLGAGMVLAVNILVCSVNRWNYMRAAFIGAQVKQSEEFYSSGTNHRELSSGLTPNAAAEICRRVFNKSRYRVRTNNSEGRIYLAAVKNRYFNFATYLGHLSLILLIIGFLIGSYAGFRNTSFIVAEGSSRPIGYGTGLSLHLDSFSDEYYPGGQPKDYRSMVTLYDSGRKVKQGTIRVNYPMHYGGVSFYQSFYGPAAKITIRSSAGETLFQDSVALTETLNMDLPRASGSFNIPGGYTIYIIAPTNSADQVIGKDEVAVEIYQVDSRGQAARVALDKVSTGTNKQLAALDFTYSGQASYSGFQVSHDPGNVLIWIASALFILGVSLVLYFPYHQVWMALIPGLEGGSRVLIRRGTGRNTGDGRDLDNLAKLMAEELKGKTGS